MIRFYKSNQLGITIMELLLAIAVSGLGFSVGFYMLKTGYHTITAVDSASNAQQMTRIAVEKISSELQETALSSIEIGSGIVSFASARDEANHFVLDDDGSPFWHKAVVYFLHDGNLYRSETDKTDWQTNYPVTVMPDVSESHQMANGVESFNVSFPAPGLAEVEVRFRPQGMEESPPMAFKTRVRIRN